MTDVRVYISGMGIISSLGKGISKTGEALLKSLVGIRPLNLFSTASNQPLPVGEATSLIEDKSLPRTHQLARLAADQAMAKSSETPDAVVMGVTTGGMLTTEALLKKSSGSEVVLSACHRIGSRGYSPPILLHRTGPDCFYRLFLRSRRHKNCTGDAAFRQCQTSIGRRG